MSEALAAALPRFHARYDTIARIGAGGMGVVYLAHDRLSASLVAIKSVVRWGAGRMDSADPTASRQADPTDPGLGGTPTGALRHTVEVQIAREFRTLASLRHPNVISVLDYGFDPGGIPFFTMEHLAGWSTLQGEGMDRGQRVAALIQVLQALRYLHRRGVIHRDIKPQNVMVGPDGRVKVLDFGLASIGGTGDARAGTYAYMAPEVVEGAPASVGSDLHAFGVMACELLHGTRPQSGLAAFGDDPGLAAVLRRLVGPLQDGYLGAEQVMEALAAATGTTLDPDPVPIRRSLIESASFVGRAPELSRLVEALADARGGRGRVIVVRGASGVGKSRLLEEVRVQALVLGVPVLQGQAAAQMRSPYRVWRDVLRGLCLHVDPTADEAQAVSAVVPDLPALVRRDVEPLGDASGSASRLRKAVEAMLRRTAVPLLVLFEDLQWADEQSAWLLRELTDVWSDVPVLVLVSCREEDWRTVAPLAGAVESVVLPRLGPEAVGAYCRSVLGVDRPELTALLLRETEGNAFFMVEVLRDLAERAAMAALTRDELPEHVSTGGMREALSRWVDSLPPSTRPTLARLAVAGREIDPKLLGCFEESPEGWLDRCASSGVVDALGDRWRFAHDKLREHVLASLGAPELAALHGDVARALETIKGDPAAIATHWLDAGDEARALPWALAAGDRALNQGAPLVARTWYEKTHALQERLSLPAPSRIPAWVGHARTLLALGAIRDGMTSCTTALQHAGFKAPDTTLGLAWALAGGVLRQALIRAGHRPPLDATEARVLAALASTADVHQVFLWGGRAGFGTLLGLRMLNLAERSGAAVPHTRALVQLVYVLALVPFASRLEAFYSRELSRMLSALDASRRGAANFVLGTVAISRGRWDEARTRLGESFRLATEAGRRQARVQAEGQLVGVAYLRGRHQDCLALGLEGSAVPSGNSQYTVWWTAIEGAIALRRGDLETAHRLLVEADAALATIGDAMATVFVGGQLSWVLRLRGDVEAARAVCARTVASTRKRFALPFGHTLVEGYSCLTQVADWLPDDDPATVLLRRQAWGLQRTHALVFPIARARLALVRGHRQRSRGRSPLRSYRAALSSAERFAMPYDELLCHEALAAAGGGEAHALRAGELAQALGVPLPSSLLERGAAG